MSSPPVTIAPDTAFPDALKLMHKYLIRQLPVVDAKGVLIGIISERDLLYASPSPDTALRVWELIYLVSKLEQRGIVDRQRIVPTPELSVWELTYQLSRLRIPEIMTRDVITTTPDASIEDAAQLILENEVCALPVVDKENRVLGIITRTDILRALVENRRGDPLHQLTARKAADRDVVAAA
jgi:acetoin utilization protein AcuB